MTDVAAEQRDIDAAIAGQTVATLFAQATERFATQEALRWKTGDEWSSWTWAEYGERARAFGRGLIALGLEPGTFVNLMGSNDPLYATSDIGTVLAGGVPVSLYNSLAPEQISYIVNHSEARFVICEDREYLERFLKIATEIGNIEKVIMWRGAEEFADNDWVISYDDVVEQGRAIGEDALDERIAAIDPEDLVTLIYTSGTTGPPKGVMVSHRNVVWTLESFLRIMPIEAGAKQISYLPMAHIAERMVGHYGPLRIGSVVSFCPDPRQVAAFLGEVRPNWFFAVPRIWEKLHLGLQNAIEGSPDDQKQAALDAIAARTAAVRLELTGQDVPADVRAKADEAEPVVAFIRQLVGLDEIQLAGTGAAPIATDIIEFFWALGVQLFEVYGQSEDTGPTSWNRPGAVRIGTVGQAIPGVEVRVADDGELLVRGGNVTQGYYKEPDLTAETFDEDGWLHSGDVAEIDDQGFIRIVDRKKEILITAGGKNVAPSNVENLLKGHALVGQACMVADKRSFATALIALDPDDAAAWAKSHGKSEDVATLAGDPDVRAAIQAHIDEVNGRLHNQEQIKRFVILEHPWTVETGEVTPTLKMKRKVIYDKYADEIEGMYAG